jgi:hypothetical protein
VIIPRRMRWEGHMAHMGDKTGAYRVLVGRLEGMEDLGIDGRVTLQWIFKKWDGRHDHIDLAQYTDSWQALCKQH